MIQRASMAGAALALFLAGAAGASTLPEPTEPPRDLAPFTFQDASGNTLDLGAFAGQVVVLNLWATWCAPCRAEMPSLDALQAELGGRGLQVLALSLDRSSVEDDALVAFYDEVGVTQLDMYRDTKMAASRALDAPGLPTTVVIGKDGREVARKSGELDWSNDDVIAMLEDLIAR
ncbi:TlpA family protein disulfide reductase [Marinivivus vitaminiproducens]|uniref:TlpA family protein disulfide reductase n=1 Tax=Marinivivus vitaminiproducens TaxID=3035935 RepID=UPI002798577C|nr:TlpA disulfide reductase family protein [Geminicoccaceae bacterium SCSIO 64248]